MPCDSQPFTRTQTLSERKEQVLASVTKLNALLAKGVVKPKIGPKGEVFFENWTAQDRAGITDTCAYRRIMAIGSSLAKAAIARAEALAGRSVNKQTVAIGAHSHDGVNWHSHKG